MNIEDIFGSMPHRPDHPDFWRLSGIILRLDSLVSNDVAPTEDDKEEAYEGNVARWIDSYDALIYMAFQRSCRAANAATISDVQKQMGTITRMMTLYTEGFQVGAEFVTERTASKELDDLDETGLRLLLSNYELHVKKAHEDGAEPLPVAEFANTLGNGA